MSRITRGSWLDPAFTMEHVSYIYTLRKNGDYIRTKSGALKVYSTLKTAEKAASKQGADVVSLAVSLKRGRDREECDEDSVKSIVDMVKWWYDSGKVKTEFVDVDTADEICKLRFSPIDTKPKLQPGDRHLKVDMHIRFTLDQYELDQWYESSIEPK